MNKVKKTIPVKSNIKFLFVINKFEENYINFNDDLTLSSLVQTARLADTIIASGLKFNWNASVRTDLFGRIKTFLKSSCGV